MKKRINLIWSSGLLLLLLLLAAFTAAAQDSQAAGAKANPMKKSDLVKALESNALSSKELVERIEQRGVDFEMNEKVEQELKNAGANSDVVDAVQTNYKAAPKKKGLFGKMTDGLGKATNKAKETVEKTPVSTVAPLLLPPPVAVAVVVAQQAKKKRDAKSKASESAETAENGDQQENPAPEQSAAKTPAGENRKSAEKTTQPPPPPPPPGSAAAALKPQMAGGFPKLIGTSWKIIDIYDKGDKPKGGRNVVPAFIFCKSGRWEIVRYGLAPGNAGAVGQIGTYKVSGGKLVTINSADGQIGTYKMTWLAAENILELEEGTIIMRLQYNGETTC